MNILAFTTLWPNSEQPGFGLFVKNRLCALSRIEGVKLRCVAPVPFFPRSLNSKFIPNRWALMSRIPEFEKIEGIETWHPRYLVTPKIGMSFYGRWMAKGAEDLIRRLHEADPIDLIDAHYIYPDGYAAVKIARKLGLRVVITARGTDINLFSELPLIRPLIKRTLEKAGHIVAVSAALKDKIVSLGIAEQKISVIRNGVDKSVFHLRDKTESRRKLGIEQESKIILAAGSLVKEKGFDRLIDAMSLLDCRDLKLYIAGEGPERERLQRKIDGLGLSKKIVLAGVKAQTELADWYSAADLLCLVSHREGCPNVVIESLSCGTPVVSVDVGGVRELISQPDCGHIIDEYSAEALAQAILCALDRKWNRAGIASTGAAATWDDVAADLIGIYKRLNFKHL